MQSSLEEVVKYIVGKSKDLKNKFTDEKAASVEFVCIFCQTEEEYQKLDNLTKSLGKKVQATPSGYVYLLHQPVQTEAGPLRLLKIRKPDSQRKERGDSDFNTSYAEFKQKYGSDPKFELIKRETFEMLRLSDSRFDVMACFSNTPLSKSLRIRV